MHNSLFRSREKGGVWRATTKQGYQVTEQTDGRPSVPTGHAPEVATRAHGVALGSRGRVPVHGQTHTRPLKKGVMKSEWDFILKPALLHEAFGRAVEIIPDPLDVHISLPTSNLTHRLLPSAPFTAAVSHRLLVHPSPCLLRHRHHIPALTVIRLYLFYLPSFVGPYP